MERSEKVVKRRTDIVVKDSRVFKNQWFKKVFRFFLLVLMPFPMKSIDSNVFLFYFYIVVIAFNIVKQFTPCSYLNYKVIYLKLFM